MAPQNTGAGSTGATERVHVIRDGLASHLPDIDPEETAEWLESFEALLTGTVAQPDQTLAELPMLSKKFVSI